MIEFEKIKFKNFLSYGNAFTEVNLKESPLTLISGKNGTGKCLRKNSKINIKFKNTESYEKFLKFLTKTV